MHVTEAMAAAVVSIDRIPETTEESVRRCILDAVAASVAGFATPGARAAREGARVIWGAGNSPIWFSSQRSTAVGAAFANSTSACILDIDDGHRAASGHPGASIVPAVLGAVQDDPDLAPRAIPAIAIGYEVGLRIAASRDVRLLETVNSGRWCGQGAAAAVGWLKRAPFEEIAEAIAAAGAVAPLMEYAEFTEVGNHVKEAIPHATANGLASLDLAQAGFLAPLDILDDTRYFNRSALLDGIGAGWLIESGYFKPFSCCRWIHSSIYGLMKIMSDNRLAPGDITHIRVETFAKAAAGLNNQKAPSSLEAALFSIPFCLGVVAVHGPELLVPMTERALLDDQDVLSIASRVEVALDEELDSHFPLAVPARVLVSCGEAVYTETVSAPLGEPQNPMSWEALFDKFHQLASSEIALHQEVRLRRALNAMRDGDLAPLLGELVEPATPREPEWRQRYFFPAGTDKSMTIAGPSSGRTILSESGGDKQ